MCKKVSLKKLLVVSNFEKKLKFFLISLNSKFLVFLSFDFFRKINISKKKIEILLIVLERFKKSGLI
jgi:hypothetical protein